MHLPSMPEAGLKGKVEKGLTYALRTCRRFLCCFALRSLCALYSEGPLLHHYLHSQDRAHAAAQCTYSRDPGRCPPHVRRHASATRTPLTHTSS
jgi:hypothetical protein